jgi:NADPH:quinone reductase-like Zn-dependent oxidoreductase
MGLRRPRRSIRGWEAAGVVEAVGENVTQLRPGDEVFGACTEAFAEYVCARDAITLKPSILTFEEAAAVPMAAMTALQGLRNTARVEPGQTVLVNGASGGVGTFAVQIAKALGAEVTAVCSTRNVEQAQSLGADRVIDYSREDFTRNGRRYDVLFDVAGSRSWRECKRALEPHGKLVIAGAPKGNRILGPLGHIVGTRVAALGSSRRIIFFITKPNKADLVVLRDLLESGKVKPAIERRYELDETADALRYIGEGHVQSKLVIAV